MKRDGIAAISRSEDIALRKRFGEFGWNLGVGNEFKEWGEFLGVHDCLGKYVQAWT
jgi:hypothetical protein